MDTKEFPGRPQKRTDLDSAPSSPYLAQESFEGEGCWNADRPGHASNECPLKLELDGGNLWPQVSTQASPRVLTTLNQT
ncbi:hypothetical protein BDV10DRAFT_163648 [Aspergillus recurvatus]